MKVIKRNAAGVVIEELEMLNIDIVKDTIIIKEPKFEKEIIKVKKVEEVPFKVKVPVFEDNVIMVDKVKFIEKNQIVEVPNYIKKDIEVTNVKINEETKTITIYKLEEVVKTVDKVVEREKIVDKIVEVEKKVDKIVEVDKVVDKLVYNTVIIDKPVYTDKEINTCIINHICPHCKKKSVAMKDKE